MCDRAHRSTAQDAHTCSSAKTTAHHPHISSWSTPHCSVSQSSRPVMSLLSVPCRPSPSAPRPSASTTSIARSRCNSPSAPARWSKSGRMANPSPNTGYDPNIGNFSSHTDPEHDFTMILPVQKHPAAAGKQKLAEFHRCSDPCSLESVRAMFRVVLSSRQLGQSCCYDNAL